MPECFIIMPVSTPPELHSHYSNDNEHFKHVLEHLFIPAVEKIGYIPISPVATGADIIHAEIIKHLESTDLVLCDISTLNPNVFFELGIRTAVDKPVSIVRDTFTTKIPFDTTIINHHTYDPSLAPWVIQNEIQSLSAHLLQTINRSENRSTLWKYFGLTKRALLNPHEPSLEQKVDYILMHLESAKQNEKENVLPALNQPKDREVIVDELIKKARGIASDYGAKLALVERTDNSITFDLKFFVLPLDEINRIENIGLDAGITIKVLGGDPDFIKRLDVS